MTSAEKVTALLDANVLYPALTRGILLELTYREVIRARWSRHIEEEWTRTLRRNRPDLDPARIERTRRLMSLHFHGALVTGYAGLIEELTLPDPDDRHVLAAAIVGECDVIVTHNPSDFPCIILDRHGLVAQHPDAFLLDHLRNDRDNFLAAVRDARAPLRNPAYTLGEFLENLRRQHLVQTAYALRLYSDQLG